jgi:peptide/nickel transport system substrate-binding protein
VPFRLPGNDSKSPRKHRQDSAKRVPILLAGALTAGLALAACGGASDAATPAGAAAGTPVAGGTLRFAINTETNCLDPHQSPADVAGFFSRPILDSLVALGDDGTIYPWLATKWSVSKDQKTYHLTLRDDVTFSDGEKFDGAAVKANLDHIVAPSTKSQLAAGTIAAYTGTTVIDPTHVDIHFSKPSSGFLATAATAYLGIEAPNTLKQSPDKLCSKIVGSGPFSSDAGYVAQRGISYVKNPAYAWGPGNAKHTGAAYLNAIDVSIITENSSRLGALTSGQVDSIASVPPVNVKQLKADSKFQIQTAVAPGGNYNYYPNTEKGVFADPRVREAFRSGIDWQTIVDKLYFGVFSPAKGPLSASTVDADPSIAGAYAYDPAKAKQLLDQAGWTTKDAQGYRTKDGKRLVVTHPYLKQYTREQRDVLADQLQASAQQLGIELKNENIDLNTFYQKIGTGDYDLADMSWQRASPDALRTLFSATNIATPATGFGTNLGRYDNPAVDQALTAALATDDKATQTTLYDQAQQQITKDAAVFPVYAFSYVLGSSKAVHGVEFEPQAYPIFYDAWRSS